MPGIRSFSAPRRAPLLRVARFVFCAAAMVLATAAAHAQEEADIRVVEGLDGRVSVWGPALDRTERIALRDFGVTLYEALSRTFHAADSLTPEGKRMSGWYTGTAPALQIYGDYAPSTNDLATYTVVLQGAATADPRVGVRLLNPRNGLDAREVTAQIVRKLFDQRVLAAAAADASTNAPTRIPRWFAIGTARALDVHDRQRSFDHVWDQQCDGMLPPLDALCAEDSPDADADADVASQLVQFWLDAPDPATRLSKLVTDLAAGKPWTPTLFLETSHPVDAEAAPATADAVWRKWLEDRSQNILTLGVTTRAFISRELTSLRLVPGENDVPADFGNGPQPLERIAEPAARPWAAPVAQRIQSNLMKRAAGRGDAYRKAASELSKLLAPIAENARRGRPTPEQIRIAVRNLSLTATE